MKIIDFVQAVQCCVQCFVQCLSHELRGLCRVCNALLIRVRVKTLFFKNIKTILVCIDTPCTPCTDHVFRGLSIAQLPAQHCTKSLYHTYFVALALHNPYFLLF
jgi:hypothetical protein